MWLCEGETTSAPTPMLLKERKEGRKRGKGKEGKGREGRGREGKRREDGEKSNSRESHMFTKTALSREKC